MIETVNYNDGYVSRRINYNIPTISQPMMPVSYVDSRTIRPLVFRDFSRYPFSETQNFSQDFQRFFQFLDESSFASIVLRMKDALRKSISWHIRNYQRIVFTDLLMYVDCMGFACLAFDNFTENYVIASYPDWVKMIVDENSSSIKAASRFGPVPYYGSQNHRDLDSCL